MRAEIAVVGLGLIGAAAVRHLAEAGRDVVGIGPPEPRDWAAHDGPFASHYDSGRITRRLDAQLPWAVLALRAIAEYPGLEARSGLRFHHPVGLVFVRNDDAGIRHQRDVIDRLALPVEVRSTTGLASGYTLPPEWTALVEPAPAGHIDPRTMLAAQLMVAENAGASIRRTWVTAMERRQGGFRLTCRDGTEVLASEVLVATGPYVNDLIEEPLAVRVMPEAVALARVSEDTARDLAALPSLIYLPPPPLYDVYVVPPVRYPDGNWYVKIGGSTPGAEALRSESEKREWMAGPAAEEQAGWLEESLRDLLPDGVFEGIVAKPCLITDTAHGLPYVDRLDDGLFVAAGGNGHAAKSADAVGALASRMVMSGGWSDDTLDRSAFRAMFGDYRPPRGSRHGY